MIKNFNDYTIIIYKKRKERGLSEKRGKVITRAIVRITTEIATSITDLGWGKAMTIGISAGMIWETVTGAIKGLQMEAGLAAFWAIIFTGIAKLLSVSIKGYLVRKYPKIFQDPDKKPEEKPKK